MNQQEAEAAFILMAHSCNHRITHAKIAGGGVKTFYFRHGTTLFRLEPDCLQIENNKNLVYFSLDQIDSFNGCVTKAKVIHFVINGERKQVILKINKEGHWK